MSVLIPSNNVEVYPLGTVPPNKENRTEHAKRIGFSNWVAIELDHLLTQRLRVHYDDDDYVSVYTSMIDDDSGDIGTTVRATSGTKAIARIKLEYLTPDEMLTETPIAVFGKYTCWYYLRVVIFNDQGKLYEVVAAFAAYDNHSNITVLSGLLCDSCIYEEINKIDWYKE